jgi:hypothetical protein
MTARSRAFIPAIARHLTRRERVQFFLLGLGTIFEGLVMTLSLGYLTVETRAWLLFTVFED